jgi:hypothetical protein
MNLSSKYVDHNLTAQPSLFSCQDANNGDAITCCCLSPNCPRLSQMEMARQVIRSLFGCKPHFDEGDDASSERLRRPAMNDRAAYYHSVKKF